MIHILEAAETGPLVKALSVCNLKANFLGHRSRLPLFKPAPEHMEVTFIDVLNVLLAMNSGKRRGAGGNCSVDFRPPLFKVVMNTNPIKITAKDILYETAGKLCLRNVHLIL